MKGEGRGEEVVGKRFALLLCAEDPEYVKKMYGGYYNVFVDLLGDDGERWDVFRALHGELPRGEDVEAYDGFVLTGSCSDAHGDEKWIKDLVEFLKNLDSLKKKVLGVCFGHQILGRALGGKTGRANNWDIGVTCIHPTSSTIKLLSSIRIPPHLPVFEFHRDEIWQLPSSAEVLASSDKTGIEMFRSGDHILGIQGHPEYSKEIILHLVDRLLQRNLIQGYHAEAARASLNSREPNKEAWKRLCKGFLKGTLPW